MLTTMHQLILVSIFGLSLACSADSRRLGGISGGGGTVLYPQIPQDPMSEKQVRETIRTAHHHVGEYLSEKKAALIQGHLTGKEKANFDRLFRAYPDVIRTYLETEVDIEHDEPCFDAAGRPVDASIIGEELGTVCISSSSIATKVSREKVFSESAALLLHEYSELVGFDEAQAVEIQKAIFEDLQNIK